MSNSPIENERKNNLKKASDMPFKKRMAYYFDYFKIPLMAVIFLSILAFFFVKDVLLAKETALSVRIINADFNSSVSDSEFIEPFLGYASIDNKKETVFFSSDNHIDFGNSETVMKLVAEVSAKECDVLICSEETLNLLSSMAILYDLSLYDDAYFVNKYQNRTISLDTIKNDTSDDGESDNAIYGIDITDSAAIKTSMYFPRDEKVYLCIGNGSHRSERTEAFVSWLLD